MLTQLDVYSPRITTVPYSLVSGGTPEVDPIQILKIDGLGPVAASINTSKLSSIDGEQYVGASVGARNIVITVRLNPDWATQSIESLRNILYKQFMPRSQVRLRFTSTHLPTVDISGYVESFEPNIFSQEPEYQISILCPFPHFTDIALTSYSFSAGLINDNTTGPERQITYAGTVKTGFKLTINDQVGAQFLSREIVIANRTLLKTETLVFRGVSMDPGSMINVNTVAGNKYANIAFDPAVTNDPVTNIVGYLTINSVWPQLRTGLNLIKVLVPTTVRTYTVSYNALYGGL